MTYFADFGLAEPLSRALADKGYTEPTPIQVQAIPPAMEGHDLCGIAQTGTGKTAAFALPILHRLAANPKHRLKYATRVLVLAPTRELASQIAQSFTDYGKYLKLTVTTVFGGVPIPRQERAMSSGVDVVVATPGRLLDLVERGSIDLKLVEILVLDEADQMLDLGFIHDLRRIVGLMPRKRQTLFFSATMPKAIEELAAKYLTNPVKVAVKPAATTAEKVEQAVIHVNQAEKPALLQMVLRDKAIERALVFSRTKHGADRIVRQLGNAGIVAEAIHGNKSQPQRERALAAFKAGTCNVLVATDIAARGIDVTGVSHVINYELPNVPESYVHRIGRTARAGANGQAIAFCAEDERPFLRDIEKLIRQKITPLALPADFRAAVLAAQKVERAAPPAPREEERRDFGARRPAGGGRPGRDPRAKVTPHRGQGAGGGRQGQGRAGAGGGNGGGNGGGYRGGGR